MAAQVGAYNTAPISCDINDLRQLHGPSLPCSGTITKMGGVVGRPRTRLAMGLLTALHVGRGSRPWLDRRSVSSARPSVGYFGGVGRPAPNPFNYPSIPIAVSYFAQAAFPSAISAVFEYNHSFTMCQERHNILYVHPWHPTTGCMRGPKGWQLLPQRCDLWPC